MPETKKIELTPSVAIIVAGVLIAGAIIFTNTRGVPTVQDGPLPQVSANVHAPTADEHIIGSPNAPLVLIEYSDFQCPFCNVVHPTLKRIVEESNGQIAWVYRHYPLDALHPEARPAAVASECITEQLGNDGFWKFADAVFADQSKMKASYYEQLAGQFGADVAAYKACVASGKYAAKVEADVQEVTSNGGQGTPYTILYDKKGQAGVSGALPYGTFLSVIKAFKERQ